MPVQGNDVADDQIWCHWGLFFSPLHSTSATPPPMLLQESTDMDPPMLQAKSAGKQDDLQNVWWAKYAGINPLVYYL